MRGYVTRRFSFTKAKVGYYDMEKNKMVECKTISGQWKDAEQVRKFCKKHREELKLPEGKQITVLSMETETELRKMTYDCFYENSVPVDETKTAEKATKKKGVKK